VGWQIGLTSKTAQDVININIPGSGISLDEMVVENGSVVQNGCFIEPCIAT